MESAKLKEIDLVVNYYGKPEEREALTCAILRLIEKYSDAKNKD